MVPATDKSVYPVSSRFPASSVTNATSIEWVHVGWLDGRVLGELVGSTEGNAVGLVDGRLETLGTSDEGWNEGTVVVEVGLADGWLEGKVLGDLVGCIEGIELGIALGGTEIVGESVGIGFVDGDMIVPLADGPVVSSQSRNIHASVT